MASEFITQGEETSVCGDYKLGAVVRRTVASTIYETETRDHHPAVIKVREADRDQVASLVDQWRNAIDLDHPNLLKIFDAGETVLDGAPAAYVVMERADESLAGALAERALSRDEVRDMLAPTLAALSYLHKNGYAHNSVKPSNVMAVGDKLKLSSDRVIRIDDGGSPAEDMRGLGVLIVQALTQKLPEQIDPAAYGLTAENDTFADIVRHCLDRQAEKRWTVEQADARLKGPLPKPVAVNEPIEMPRPRVVESAIHPVSDEGEADQPTRGFPKWVFAALAALVLAIVLIAVMRQQDGGTTAAPVTPGPIVAESSSTAPAVTPEPPKPSPVTPAPAVTSPVQRPARPLARETGRKSEGWSVISAAYGSREAAEKRMQEMSRRFPKFKVSVFEQNSDRARFLVVLGQNLSEDAAEALRQRAVRSGLPRDTYIKRVM